MGEIDFAGKIEWSIDIFFNNESRRGKLVFKNQNLPSIPVSPKKSILNFPYI